ncbi:MAG: metallophosphoesterase, partial [Thermoplasmata archaeon]|nr:metallophosphoesterase [Thermoplasmata archaeon]
MRDRLLSFFTERGTLLEPDAIEHILSKDDPIEYAERFVSSLEEDKLIVTMQDVFKVESVVRDVVEEHKVKTVEEEITVPDQKKISSGRAKDFDSDIEIKKDITGNSTCEGTIQDFQKYFNHRFQTLGAMIRARREMRGCIEISKAKKKTGEMRFVCIVTSARDTRGGHRIIEVEDVGGSASVLVLNTAIDGSNIVPDEVIGVIGKPGKNDLIIAERIIRPDFPAKGDFVGCDEPVSVAFVADIHVGSNAFMQDKWEEFMKWLNNGDEISSSIKYMVIPGDAVDGIGIYPRQDEELLIDDIYEQYEELARLLEAVPDYIKIIIAPGNHDAVRPAEPQPAL